MPRLFVAAVPPASVREHLAEALLALRGFPGEPRWVPADRWHLTLLYLGKVPEERTAQLGDALRHAVAGTGPIPLRLEDAGRFGAGRRPQVFWTGLGGDLADLTALADRLRDAAAQLGQHVDDRPFRAHLTVGRWRTRGPVDGALPERLAGYRGPEWPVTEVALVESHLGADPRYETVDAWAL